MNAPRPSVSVCIPTYRGAQTIGPAIASVLAQSHGDFELVVIDDGSPDDTAEVVQGFSDPRIRYLRNDRNLGAEGNWNRCLDEARGLYFKLLPHDDILSPDCLERQTRVLEGDRDGNLALVFGARDVLGPDGQKIMRRGLAGAAEGRIAAAELRRRCIRQGTNVIGEPGAVMFRLAAARQIGRFDARYPYLVDMDYWFRLLSLGDAHYCDAVVAGFRVSAAQWSVALTRQQSSDFRACVARLAQPGDREMPWHGRVSAWLMPGINALARQAFYKWYLR